MCVCLLHFVCPTETKNLFVHRRQAFSTRKGVTNIFIQGRGRQIFYTRGQGIYIFFVRGGGDNHFPSCEEKDVSETNGGHNVITYRGWTNILNTR